MDPREPRTSDRTRHPVTVTRQVDPLAWQTALDLAGGDVSRIEVESPTVVWVR